MTSYEDYDKKTGVSTYRAPGLLGEKGSTLYKYYDPFPRSSTEQHIPAQYVRESFLDLASQDTHLETHNEGRGLCEMAQ